jgi:hypothetical protein
MTIIIEPTVAEDTKVKLRHGMPPAAGNKEFFLYCCFASEQPNNRAGGALLLNSASHPMRVSAAVAEPRTLDHAGRLMRSSLAASF